MRRPTVSSSARPVETSTFRLYVMRALYLLIAVGLGLEVWPRVLGAGEPLGSMSLRPRWTIR